MPANMTNGVKNPAKWAEAKARVAEQKGRGEGQFTDQDWLEVKRIYGQSIEKSEGDLEKIIGLSHALSAPTSLVGGAADLETDIKNKAKQLSEKLKKKKKITKSDYAKIVLIKSLIKEILNS